MINKKAVGNRINALRKQRGYSQSSFSEKLGVTSQAVSKWETGLALPDIDILLAISKTFKVSINEILEGRSVFDNITNRSLVMYDFAHSVSKEELEYNKEWAKNMISGGWVKRNWEWNKNNIASRKQVAKRIVEHGGLILEIGTGPGGGYMPAILLEDFDAEIIISDLSPTVVREWKRLFDSEINPPNVHYIALDNCDLPFKDNSVDVISAGGGFGNTEGDKFKALTEIYRVLKPGGLYVSGDGFVTQETLKKLPLEAQKILLEKRPDIFQDYYEASVTAGFKTIDNILGGGWSTKNDESFVADLARELDVEIIFTGYLRFCTK